MSGHPSPVVAQDDAAHGLIRPWNRRLTARRRTAQKWLAFDTHFDIHRNMDITLAVKRLSALSQDSRLAVFRLLVKAGPDGVAAGEIARVLEITPNTLSAQLTILSNAGLTVSRREGRSIIYTADYDAMSELLLYLMDDCCQGRPEVCAPLAAASRASNCENIKGSLS